jgi:hypothetical protein
LVEEGQTLVAEERTLVEERTSVAGPSAVEEEWFEDPIAISEIYCRIL